MASRVLAAQANRAVVRDQPFPVPEAPFALGLSVQKSIRRVKERVGQLPDFSDSRLERHEESNGGAGRGLSARTRRRGLQDEAGNE